MRALAIACALLVATAAHAQTTGGGDFDAALHAQLRAKKGNLFYSPTSARIALAMAMFGARGPTQSELAKALSWQAGPKTARAIGALLGEWEQTSNARRQQVVLRVANRVWTQRGHQLLDDYVTTEREVFHAAPGVADFARNAAGARNAINKWVADATENMIPSLVETLSADTTMVLTNAVYFKGKWASPFLKGATRRETFFASGAKTVTVQMMHWDGVARVARIDGALVLEVGYGSDGRVAMDIVLPTARDGIGAIEDAYVKGALPRWLQQLSGNRVDVSLPKLRMSSALDLLPALRGLGVSRATSPTEADFSGMDGTRDLHIGAVLHKAEVDVDEDGTEAAATTSIEMDMASLEPQVIEPIVFRADHPFLFVIRDTTADFVLFAGRVVDPMAR